MPQPTNYPLSDRAWIAEMTARNVRGWMARERWSARKLAPVIGISDVALSRRLRGEVDFTVTEICHLAEILRCRLTDLLPEIQQTTTRDCDLR